MTFEIDEDDYLAHYGILRRSGRYPWGSGETPLERAGTFSSMLTDLRNKGLTDAEIARGFSTKDYPFTTSQLRETNTIARNTKKQADIAMAQRLRDKGMSNVAIGQRMGIPESSVRSLLTPSQKDRADILNSVTDMLRSQVDSKGFIDIGTGVELHLGISKEKLGSAVARLKDEDYEVIKVQVDQLGTGNKTLVKVLAPPGTKYGDVKNNMDKIHQIVEYSQDGGKSWTTVKPPLSISSSRIKVRYAEEGGTDADGVIYVRPGVNDLALGGGRYAQVRIAVDGTHYLKGMAMYKDDLPDGVDLIFNTNKSDTGNKLDAMKKMERDKDGNIDSENPFGSMIQRQILTPDGKTVTSAMNLVNEEGSWEKWSKSLSSQVLSKQSPTLAKSQLDMAHERKKNELNSILELNNPAVKKKLLEAYADGADASAIHLKAASLPRQGTHVILPINSMKETEIYAPNYTNGERVVLIRFPHGGIFEIPELTVNNRHSEARKLLGNARDAVGINSKIAERLSGADFDGDTVLVIPNNNGRIQNKPALEKLKGFDPKHSYPPYDGMKTMGGGVWDAAKKEEIYPPGRRPSDRVKGIQMGLVSNLITDMTIRGATDDELARAVRHSMVVIDAQKHNLDYKRSASDNGIPSLMAKYQGRSQGGAATVVSNSGAKATTDIPERRASFKIDPQTGRKIFTETGATVTIRRVNKRTGAVVEKVLPKTEKVPKLAAVDNAHALSSGTRIEKVYADYSNSMKDLANEARKAMVNTRTTPHSPSAKAAYSKEVARLNAALDLALRNAPLERQAQILANAVVRQKQQAYPDMDEADLKKVKSQALAAMRERTGAGKSKIIISASEWDAIQAGAFFNNRLDKILDNADLDQVKELATPRSRNALSPTEKTRALTMLAAGFTQSEVALQLGVSVSTLKDSIKE